jgi:hypothetical protein
MPLAIIFFSDSSCPARKYMIAHLLEEGFDIVVVVDDGDDDGALIVLSGL